MAVGDGIVWSEALPDNDTVANEIDDYNRDLRIAVRSRLALEHVFPAAHTGTGSGGRHTYITFQVQTAAPTMAGTTGGAIWVKSSGLGIYITDSGATDYLIVASAKGLAVIPAGTGTWGDVIIGSSANGYTVTRLAGSADGRVLHTHSNTAAPNYLPIDLAGTSTVLTGVLPAANAPSKANLGIDSGSVTTISGTDVAVSFNFTFASAPKVVISMGALPGADHSFVLARNITTTGFNARSYVISDTCHWIAIGTPA